MISLGRTVRVFAYSHPADLRKSFNGLYGLVKSGLGRDPLSGDLFLFVNRRRTSCKVLMWDGTGLCILQKRLERGRFATLWRPSKKSVQLTPSELSLFLEGCTLVGRRELSPAVVVPVPLAVDRAM